MGYDQHMRIPFVPRLISLRAQVEVLVAYPVKTTQVLPGGLWAMPTGATMLFPAG